MSNKENRYIGYTNVKGKIKKVFLDLSNTLGVLPMGKQGSGRAVYGEDAINELEKHYNNTMIADLKKEDINKKDIPNNLKDGSICIGYSTVNKESEKVFFSDSSLYKRGLMISGKQGSGKSVYLENYINDCVKNGDSSVIIDYVGSDLASNIKEIVPKDKLLILDFEDIKSLQSLSYAELNYADSTSKSDKIRAVYIKSKYTLDLLNCLSDEELNIRERRDFASISNIVYAVNSNAGILDIVNCLTDENIRVDYIDRIPEDLKEVLEDEINIVKNLKNNPSSIEQILNRITLLKECMTTNIMLKNTSENYIDFEKCFNEGKVIVVKIDRDIPYDIRNMLSLFFITKTYLSCKNRLRNRFELNPVGELSTVHLIIDEVDKINPYVVKKINDIIYYSMRPYYLKPVLTTQSLSLLSNDMLRAIHLSDSDYMFMSSLDEETYRILESKLSPYTFDDVKNIEKYHSLNLVSSSNSGRKEVFITKLPDILETCEIK